MAFTDLDQASEDARYRIHTYVQELNGEAVHDAAALFAIAWEHRQLAICHLLQDGDPQRFQAGLRRAGLAWSHLLRLMDAGMPVQPRLVMGSRWHALTSAVAANDPALSQTLAARFPGHCDGDREYAADYFPIAVLRAVVQSTDDAVLVAFCDRWEGAIGGDESSALAVWRAIGARDGAGFHQAFSDHIAHRQDQMAAYRKSFSSVKPLAATEGGLCIYALAMAQIARSRGLGLPSTQPMCPSLALVPAAGPALPADAWRTFD